MPIEHAFETISPAAVTGGDSNQSDFASRYVQNLHTDWNDMLGRMRNVAVSGITHRYADAAKNAGATAIDELGLIGDALAPFKAAFE